MMERPNQVPMSESPSRPDHSSDGIDAATQQQLADVLEQYVADLEQGRAPAVDELATQYPQLAELLPEYLEGVQLIHSAMLEASPVDAIASSADNSSLAGETNEAALLKAAEGLGNSQSKPKQIGDYELVREIGRGGMGVVYEARQLSLNRRVALKVLPFAAVLDERQIARFRTEAQAAAGLHHSNIVPVFAVGQERGVHFYAMQYIDGQSLGEVIHERLATQQTKSTDDQKASSWEGSPSPIPAGNQKTISPNASTVKMRISATSTLAKTAGTIREASFFRSVALLGAQAAEALEHAHQYGVVHRDIKPTNLLVDPLGKLWITDFGLARVQSEMSITLPGDIVGTLRYMSPEQAQGRGDLVDGRTDVYALGATLYEMVTLQPAHPGDDHHAMVQRIQSIDPPSPRKINPAVPLDLETIILRAMEKSRDDRYTSAGALADDLRRFLDGKPTVARRPNLVERTGKWLARRRGVAMTAAGALMLVTAISVTSAIWIAAALAESRASQALAESHYRQARSAVDHFGGDLADRLAELPGSERLRQELLRDTQGYYQQFLHSASDDTALRDDVAATHFKSAAIAERLGDLLAARNGYRQAVQAWQEMPAQPSQLAMGMGNLARVEGKLGEIDSAKQNFQAAIQRQQSLVASEPTSARHASDLAETLANYGLLLRRVEDQSAAIEHLREAIVWLQRAAKLEPNRVETIRHLAVTHNNLSDTLRDASPTASAADEARQAGDAALAAMQQLVKLEPVHEGYRADLAMTHNNRAALAGASGDWAAAAAGYRAAAGEIARLVGRYPLVPRHRRELAITQSNLGLALARLEDHSASDAAFAVATETLERLIEDFPTQPIYRQSLSALWNNRGVALRASERLDESLAAFASAIELQGDLGKSNSQPLAPHQLALLDKQYQNYADALRAAKRLEQVKQIEARRQDLLSTPHSSHLFHPVD